MKSIHLSSLPTSKDPEAAAWCFNWSLIFLREVKICERKTVQFILRNLIQNTPKEETQCIHGEEEIIWLGLVEDNLMVKPKYQCTPDPKWHLWHYPYESGWLSFHLRIKEKPKLILQLWIPQRFSESSQFWSICMWVFWKGISCLGFVLEFHHLRGGKIEWGVWYQSSNAELIVIKRVVLCESTGAG